MIINKSGDNVLLNRDIYVLSVVLSILLATFGGVKFDVVPKSIIPVSLFLIALIVHSVPAYTPPNNPFIGKFLSSLDPYYYYRHANYIVSNGTIPEKETLAYPTKPPTWYYSRLMVSLLMASFSLILKPFGVTVHDVAMLYPSVFSAFTVLIFYLLLKELFKESDNSEIIAFLGAFMLALSPAFGMKSIAANCEDDALGMFLAISFLYLFIKSIRLKSLKYSFLSGLSLLILNLSWSGYLYFVSLVALFSVVYSTINFISGRNCTEHVKFFIIPILISWLYPLFFHPKGVLSLEYVRKPEMVALLGFCVGVSVPLLLEFLRGVTKEFNLKRVIHYTVSTPYVISVAAILIIILVMVGTTPVLDFLGYLSSGAKVRDIVGMTTAEQKAMCDKILSKECVVSLYNYFGISTIFGIFSIPFLIYNLRKDMGPSFVLCWGVPSLWFVTHKVQYIFITSVGITALGSSIGSLLSFKISELKNSFKIIPTICVLVIPIVLSMSGVPVFKVFSPPDGRSVLYQGSPVKSRVYWEPALQWLKQQEGNVVVLTWWDYGHWITAISNKTSIVDNVKAHKDIVQDIAKFHVLIENESEALELAKRYGTDYVIFDFDMIAKSGAPHFIATSTIRTETTKQKKGEYMGYGMCVFSPKHSELKGRLETLDDGSARLVRNVVFLCSAGGNIEEYIGAIVFDIVGNKLTSIKVFTFSQQDGTIFLDGPVSWETLQEGRHSSILGVLPFGDILSNCLNYGTDSYSNFPTLNTLVYVPEKFNNYMMTRMYLGDYLDEYKSIGLADKNIRELKHFQLVESFSLGYVKVYRIID